MAVAAVTEPLIEDDDETYIFSKDRRNHSGECSSSESVTTYQYVNGDYERRVERNILTQQSMPNLKQNGKYRSYGSLTLPKYSESEPLLGGNNFYGYNICGQRNRFLVRRTQIFLFFYIVFFVGYLILGSICFQRLERETELDVRRDFREARQAFLLDHPSVSDDDLEKFIADVLKASNRGISALKNASSELNWSFGQAIFFSTTVVTTIGYGHVTPLSQAGKLFCLLYATIGIPLTLVLLSAVVERLLTPANWLLGALNSRLGHLYQPFNIRILHLFIIVFIVATLFLFIPTAIFAYLEESWGILDAFYYCFISLTTIGLGDYIPGDDPELENRSLYKIGTTCYLIFGLIAVMLSLTVFYDIPQLNLGQLFTENGVGEAEKLRSSRAPCYSGPSGLYIPQQDDEMRRAVVRIRPRGDDSPGSPDDPTPMHARDIRVP